MTDTDLHRSGFKETTRIATARTRLREVVTPLGRAERVPVGSADGRVLAEPVRAVRDVPHYARAAMDGYAVRAADTFGASARSPEVLRRSPRGEPGGAVRVHTGSELPEGTDAVVLIEHVEEVGDEVEVFDAVAAGENVGPVGEDVETGTLLYEPGHRLRPSDAGMLRSVGVHEVRVVERPTVAVLPTGEELVDCEPGPGEVVETNGLTVSQYVHRWGGTPTYRDVVTDDEHALRAAIRRDLTRDVVVTTGGSSVGERDLLPEVVADLGEVLVHGVALKPGHPVALGVVEGTPVLMLPGYPVACIVNAVQFLRPTIAWLLGREVDPHATLVARLSRKVRSQPGVRTFARVRLERADESDADGDDLSHATCGCSEGSWLATPTRAGGSGILSSVALADGWVAVPESRDGIPEGESVSVQLWEWSP